jgi:hypothetical protein
LMGLACPELVAFFFSKEGDLLKVERRKLTFLKPSGVFVDGELVEGLVRRYDIYDPRIVEQIFAWQQEIDFQAAPILVKGFFLDELSIGIETYPRHFHEILMDANTSEAERNDIRNSMQAWDADRQFVLLWGNDYWFNEDGDVVSS